MPRLPRRAENALACILGGTDGNIIVAAHSGFNRALICGLYGIDLNELFSIPQPFGCMNILFLENGICRVRKTGLQINNMLAAGDEF